jgi:hypothetical protein
MKTAPQPAIISRNPDFAIPATMEQLAALGVTAEEIAKGEKRFDFTHFGPWHLCRSIRAVVEFSHRDESGKVTLKAFFPARTMHAPRSCGYDLEGRIPFAGRKASAFTTSQMFELPDGRLVEVATLHLCRRSASDDTALAALAAALS